MKKSVKRILMSLMVIVGLVVSVGLGFFANVQAMSGYVSKGEASALIECYDKGAFKSPVGADVFKDKVKTGTDLFMNGTQKVYVPIDSTFFKISPATTKATCSELVSGLLKNKGVSIPKMGSTAGEIKTFMENLGYKNNAGSDGKTYCFNVRYTITYSYIAEGAKHLDGSKDENTQSICAEIEDGKVARIKEVADSDESNVKSKILVMRKSSDSEIGINYEPGSSFVGSRNKDTISITPNETTWKDFKEEVKNSIRDHAYSGNIQDGVFLGGYTASYKLKLDDQGNVEINEWQDGDAIGVASYEIESASTEAKQSGTKTLLGEMWGSKPGFSNDDIYSLYNKYLEKFYGVTTKFEGELTEDQIKGEKYKETKACKDGKMLKAYKKATKNEDKKVGIVKSGEFGAEGDWKDMVDWLKDNYSEGEECPEESNPEPGPNPDDPNNVKGDIVDCNDLKTIGAMQWVLCPTMNNMQYTTSWIDNMTQDWLQVDTKLYSGPQVTEVWGYIRNVANVLMIVFLLVVIFSQLTGRGIDNYGIKKMLPRLIMMALIINLSMYICQLAVDLSNIAGSGLRDMFGAFGAAASGTEKPGDPSFLTGMIMGMFAAADVGGAVGFGTLATLTALAAPTAVAIVIAVIVLLLAILVAVVVLFLMLGAREIIVIVCVVISPLAFAAYVLPNTQNLFKKWWELFKAALIIFPICGAMGGISSMLRKMAETGPDLHIWGFAILMILPYLGFFLIPMLLKNAIAALGKIGGALTAMGNKVKSGGQIIGKNAMNVAKNTEKYKQLSAEAAKKKQAKMSQKTIDKLEALKKEKEARGEKLSDRDAQRLYDAQQMQTKLKYEQEMANIGAVVPSSEQIHARATSAKDTQEMKLIMDSYAGFGRTRMANELTNAYTSYLNNRSESNGLRLRAALSKADSMGMDKELLNVLNGTDAATGQTALLNSGGAPLSQLGFRSEVDGKETEDAKIATTLAGLNNKVANRFGKQLGKAPEDELSLNQFATNMGAGGLREAISGKGPDYLNGVDEDTVGFLAKASEQAGGNVVDTETLLHAAASTTDTKVNNNLAGMLANADSSKPSGLTGKILVAQRGNALSAITNQVKNAGYGSEIHKEFMKATTDIANNPELLSTLTKEQAKMFNEVRGDKLFKVDDGGTILWRDRWK